MKISAGLMDRRVTLLRPTQTQDAFGGPVLAFAHAGVRWCSRLAFQATEAERDAMRETFASVRLLLRNQAPVDDMDTRWRLLFEGEELEIVGIDRAPLDGSAIVIGKKTTSPAYVSPPL